MLLAHNASIVHLNRIVWDATVMHLTLAVAFHLFLFFQQGISHANNDRFSHKRRRWRQMYSSLYGNQRGNIIRDATMKAHRLLVILLLLSAPLVNAQTAQIANSPLASAATENPRPLDRTLVEDMLARFRRACDTRDGDMLLRQFSARMQIYFMRGKPASLYDRLAYICLPIANLASESKGKKFASFHDGNVRSLTVGREGTARSTGKTYLCMYETRLPTSSAGCGVDIAFEDGMLKLDEQ
jgi:hypothetical protein